MSNGFHSCTFEIFVLSTATIIQSKQENIQRNILEEIPREVRSHKILRSSAFQISVYYKEYNQNIKIFNTNKYSQENVIKNIYIYQHSRRVPDRLKPWPMKIRNQKISKQENQKYGLHQEHFKTVIKVWSQTEVGCLFFKMAVLSEDAKCQSDRLHKLECLWLRPAPVIRGHTGGGGGPEATLLSHDHSGYRQPAIDQYICEIILNRSWIKKR